MANQNANMTVTLNDRASTQLSQIIQRMEMINARAITAVVRVNDRASNSLNSITARTRTLRQRFQETRNQIKEFSNDKALEKFNASLQKSQKAIMNFAKSSITAAQSQAGNEIKLASTLKLRNKATAEQISSILSLTSAQQQNGVVSDDVQMAGAAQLSSYVESTENIQTLIPAMNNLLVQQKGLNGTSEDAAKIADLMGESLNGNIDGLKKAGLTFNDAQKKVFQYGTKEEKVAALAEVIADNVGNANEEISKTDAGSIKRASHLFLDLKEQIGNALLPYLAKFAKWFSENQPTIKGIIESLVEKISGVIQKTYGFFSRLANFVKKHQEILVFFINFIAVISGIIWILSIVATVVTTIAGILSALTIIQNAFNLTLGACPIIWIIAVIVGLIAIIVALILYWDVVKQKAGEVWASIVAAFEPLGEFFSGLWDGIKAGFKAFINFIIDGINSFTSTLSWIPEELSKVSGFEWAANFVIKPIPNFALGIQYFKGGLAQINERGGEIVDLPNGSKVIPADKSKSMLNGGNVSIGNIYNTAKGVTANEVVNEIVPQLKLRLANM